MTQTLRPTTGIIQSCSRAITGQITRVRMMVAAQESMRSRMTVLETLASHGPTLTLISIPLCRKTVG
ncbi:MAG: hypothetical protein ACE5R6_10730 [Candidatus Heimdallarchaeota archaeon]